MGSTALFGMGAGMQAMGAMNQARTQQQVLGYEAAIASNNQSTATYQAQQEQIIGAQQEQVQRLKTASMFSSQRAQMAANGVDLGQGSANEVLTSTEMMGEKDALTIRDNAARREWAYRTQAQNYGSEAAADKSMASNINPMLSTGTSLLGSASLYKKNWG